ncbi:calnexin Cnx1 [Datura stramonium]|uniref:Molybdopterin biosynthesis protein CNX1 n=1 Tax=Datura stramonium TaxID=4076 RepID=A0ABS8TPM8_DATST|nr:calnexin Cnx1 [Datura stramonium]
MGENGGTQISTNTNKMISVEEALEIVLNVAQRLSPVTLPIQEVLGKVLAEDITAPDPLPPYPASIKDGYAVVAADGPGEYPVITESRAGNDAVGVTVTRGTVAYVTTGGYKSEESQLCAESICMSPCSETVKSFYWDMDLDFIIFTIP